MYDIQIETSDKWHNLSDFDSYEEIEELGEILAVYGLPDGLDLESDFDNLKTYAGMDDNDQKIVMAYYKATNVFNPEEAMEAYVGNFVSGAEFARELCEEVEYEALRNMPVYLRHDYFEFNGYYFRNL